MEVVKALGIKCISNRTVLEKDAVMFDIDETLIYINGKPITEMIELFQICKKMGYRVVIITARPDFAENHYSTIMQLIKHNLNPDEIYFTSPEKKTTIKKETGLHYVLSVGDLYTDLGHTDYFIKLPDNYDRNFYSNIKTQ
jgi:ribonucleotide monophosphatase NagD (HAD superfamily)